MKIEVQHLAFSYELFVVRLTVDFTEGAPNFHAPPALLYPVSYQIHTLTDFGPSDFQIPKSTAAVVLITRYGLLCIVIVRCCTCPLYRKSVPYTLGYTESPLTSLNELKLQGRHPLHILA